MNYFIIEKKTKKKRLDVCLHLEIYRSVSLKLGMMMVTIELYILIPV